MVCYIWWKKEKLSFAFFTFLCFLGAIAHQPPSPCKMLCIFYTNVRIWINLWEKYGTKFWCWFILTSTKNASLIITDFLAIIYKTEQSRTASLCRGYAMLENDFNLICRWPVIPMTSYSLNVHMTVLCIERLWFQFEFAPSLCR